MEKQQVATRGDILEFDDVKGIRVSQSFKTPKGDSIKVVHLMESRVIMVGKNGLLVQVDGNIDHVLTTSTVYSWLSDAWDKLTEVAGKVKDVLGGAGCQQNTGNIEVNVTVSGSGASATLNPNSVSVTVNCTTPK